MATQTVDPWFDADFGQVDFSRRPEDAALEVEPPTPSIFDSPFEDDQTPAPVAQPVVETAPEPVEPEGPEVIDLGDGSYVEIEKSSKGWKASLKLATGGAENFYGKTKNELIKNIAVGKINATKKIRELNKQVKLGTGTEAAPAVRQAVQAPQNLTADDVFAIKTQLESNPDLALETWFQKKTGMSVGQLVGLAQLGQRASQELDTEQVNKNFVARNPGYYPDPNYENFSSLVAYIAKNKIGKTLNDRNKDELYNTLVAEGQWTVQNLDEAFSELNEAGLLVSAPQRPEVKPVVQQAPPTPAPLPANPRIVSHTVQPRAGLGLRSTEATPVRQEAPKPPSVDDLSNLSNEEIANLYQQSLRYKRLQSRRS
jgi:hypothetical protein